MLEELQVRSCSVMPSDGGAKFLVVVAFFIERDGQVLLLRRARSKDHAPGEWECGSGRVQRGESAEQAVIREATEETGLHVEVLDPIDTFHFYRGEAKEEAIGVTFHCLARGGVVALSSEHDEAKWIPVGGPADPGWPEWVQRGLQILAARQGGHRQRRLAT